MTRALDRRRRLRGGDDRGYAVVLGAMVLLGMGMIAFTTYKTTLAPQLEQQSEAQKMDAAADRLASWTAASTVAGDGPTAAGQSVAVPLGHSSPPFATSASASTLRLEPGTAAVDLDARNLTVSRLNGTLVDGTDDVWRSTDDASVGEIEAVDRFRLRVEEIDSSHTGESVTVNVSDASGTHAGDLRLSVEPVGGDGQGYELVVRTRGADGDVLYEQPILISSTTHDSHTDPISPYWVNLLNSDYQFDRVLAAAEPPYEVALEQDGLESDYTLQYTRTGGDDAAGGLLLEGYNASFQGGTLRYEGRAAQAEDQSLTVEHGALIRAQRDGAVFVKPPAFSASLVDHTVHVSLALSSLDGSTDQVSSGSLAMVNAAPTGRYALAGEATNLTVNLTTEHPELWRDHLAEQLADAGLTAGQGFETASGAGWARVDVWGLMDPDPASDRYDVGVDLRVQELDVAVGG